MRVFSLVLSLKLKNSFISVVAFWSFNMEVEEPKPKKKAPKKKVSEDTLLSKINKKTKGED